MVVPTTKRQFYDTTKKVSAVAEYAGAVREGAEAWGKLFDSQQGAKIESSLGQANVNINDEFNRVSPQYDNNPDNPEFKAYMDDYRKQQYDKAREDINPFYRGQFDEAVRKNNQRFDINFSEWQVSQRKANASNDVKNISADLINNAYMSGQSGNLEQARAVYNEKANAIRNVSTATLGARATEQGLKDLNSQYLMAFAKGQLDSAYDGGNLDAIKKSESLLADNDFMKEVGLENAEKLKNYAVSKQNHFKKQYVSKMVAEFNANPNKQTLDMIKSQDIVKISDKAIEDLESTYKESPNYVCETEAEALLEVGKRVADFSGNDYSIKDGKEKGGVNVAKQFEDAITLTKFIMSQNSKDGKLSDSDRSKYMETVAKVMQDSNLKNAFNNTRGEFVTFLDNIHSVLPSGLVANTLTGGDKRQTISSNDKLMINSTVSATMRMVMESLESGDVETARKAFFDGNKDIQCILYPELRGKGVGDTFSRDGEVYRIEGFNKDGSPNVTIMYK